MNYVGIDIAKRNHVVAVCAEDGAPHGKAVSFSNDEEGFRALFARFTELGVDADECIVAMESTGHYWIACWEALVEHGFPVAVVNPVLTDAFRKSCTVRKTKTDSIDAFLIADYARFRRLGPTSVSPEEVDGMKGLARFRASLVKERTALKNRVTALADRLFPELAKCTGGMQSATFRALLRQFGTPAIIASTDIRTLTRVICEASRGRHGRDKAEKIKALAKKSVGATYASKALAFEIKHAVELVDHLDSEISSLDSEIASMLDATEARLLLTIPGIGAVNAATIAAEMGPAENFEDAKKLIAYAGIDASKRQSGDFEGTEEHMSKRGSSYLRYALMNASDIARQHDPYFGDYYDSMRARGKHHYVALSGVARKLCGVILAVLKEKRAYEPRQSIQSQQKELVKS